MSASAPKSLSPEAALQQAIAHHQAGRLQEAEQLGNATLQAPPTQTDASSNFGLLLARAG